MGLTTTRSAPVSDAKIRATEWEKNFRRAEMLLAEAQATLRRSLATAASTTGEQASNGDNAA